MSVVHETFSSLSELLMILCTLVSFTGLHAIINMYSHQSFTILKMNLVNMEEKVQI